MDFKLSRENFTVRKVLSDAVNEQAVELDYVLPDYCPEIFKVLSCRIYPSAARRTLNGSKLSYELSVLVRVVYLSENGSISAFEQTLCYDKSLDLGFSPKLPAVYIEPSVSSKSCRVVNKRRVDIRGVVSVGVKAVCDDQLAAVTSAKGGGIQLKCSKVTYPAKRLFITKRVTVIDEVEIMPSKPAVGVVLRADASVASAEKKVLSGKLLTKGEVSVTVIYIPEGGGEIERLSFDLPFSQVSDIEGLDDRFDVFVDACASSCTVTPSPKSEPAKLGCEIGIDLNCLALRFETASLCDDVFSTEFEAEAEKTECPVECLPEAINESHRVKATLTYSEGEIKSVMCALADAGGAVKLSEKSNGDAAVSGKICFTVFAKNESDKPVCLESEITYEHIPEKGISGCDVSGIRPAVGAVTYNLVSSNAIEISAEVKLRGYVCEVKNQCFVSDIRLNTEKPVERDKATSLKLYYAEAGETPWEIAKRCRAGLDAILEENEIESGAIAENTMLLIPIE